MRTFIAIAFPETIHQQLRALCGELQSHLRAQYAPNCLRWVPVQNIHLTLRFLGEITQDQAQVVATGLHEVGVAHAPFSLTIGGIGGFPHLRQPRVLWLGVGGELPHLNALQTAVEQTVQLAGLKAEQRPFSAHITLARAQRNAARTQLHTVGSHLTGYTATTEMAFRVEEIVHMRSALNPGGAVYSPLGHFSLRASSI